MAATEWDNVTSGSDTVSYTEWNLMRDRIKDFIVVGTTDSCDYVCDGTADDVQINAAITEAISGNGVVHILGGTYNLTDPILINGAVSLIGDGPEYTEIKASSGFDNDMIQINSTQTNAAHHRVIMKGIKFNGDYSNQTTGSCLVSYGGIEGSFIDCHWEKFYDYGVHLFGCQGYSGAYGHHNRFSHCLFDQGENSSGQGTGLYMKNNDENEIVNCEFQYCKTGIRDETGFNRISNSSFVDGNIGIYIQDSSRTGINNCVFDYCAEEGVRLKGAFNNVNSCTFYRCADNNTSKSFLYIDWYGTNNVSNNTFMSQNNSTKPKGAIEEVGNASEDTYGHNIIAYNLFLSVSDATTLQGSSNWGTSALIETNTNDGTATNVTRIS